jgi:hypothetical protein
MYKWWGYSTYTPKAHMNSIDLDCSGSKSIAFADGTVISFDPLSDTALNTVWGTLVHLPCGRVNFKDPKNGLTGWYEINSVKKKPKDYFRGEIIKEGEVVSKMYGNYMGYIDFDGVRYWDVRDQTNYM